MVESRLFDLSKDQVAELGIRIEHGRGSAHVTSTSGPLFDIINGIGADDERDINNYHVRVCYTGFSGESQTTSLLAADSDKTIGYIFPITSFRSGDNLGGAWPRRFADVGFRSVTVPDTLAIFSNFGSTATYRGAELFLDEVIPDELSVMVLGRESLAQWGVDLKTTELMLTRAGVSLLSSLDDVATAHIAGSWTAKTRLMKPGPLVADDAQVFLNLVRSADHDRVGVGAFMHLYQAMEFCIDHIFNWGVSQIAKESLDTWEMKARLSEITGESHRLGILDAHCLGEIRSRGSLIELQGSCSDFLNKLSVEHDASWSWHRLLYKCRNIVVHNQVKMLKASAVPLQHLNTCLRAAALDILFAFSLPTTK